MTMNIMQTRRHEVLDDLVAEFLRYNADKSPDDTTIAELMVWSCRGQTDWPGEVSRDGKKKSQMRPARKIELHNADTDFPLSKGPCGVTVLEAEVRERTLEIYAVQHKHVWRLTYRGDFTVSWEDVKIKGVK